MCMNYTEMPPKAIIFDFDGVFTSNTVYVSEDGVETVRCSRSDGLGIALIKRADIPVTVISTERNPVVTKRCNKLRVPVKQGCDDKVLAATKWLSGLGIKLSDTVFVGNDINDLPLLEVVGHPWCVNDAWPAVKKISSVQLRRNGGDGAVREACERILSMATAQVSENSEKI